MSTQPTFQRKHLNELYSTLINGETSSVQGNKPLADYTSSSLNLASERPTGSKQPRPFSEILKHESFISPETEALDKWYEDLQQYESNLEAMASASVDPKFKEEVQHVDQWFRYLNEAERTATIYTLLQHSSQVQIRFFITVLQQMSNRDPLGALLSPHPDKVDMQTQLAGAMAKAELEASQKLMTILPYQTGQVASRPHVTGRRNHIDRHSFALGDTEEYDRLFSRSSTVDLLNPQPNFAIRDDGLKRSSMFDSARPKSVMLDDELSSIFSQDWPYTAGLVNQQNHRTGAISRPKSADVSNWSFNLTSSVSSKSLRDKDPLSGWSTLSPTVANFNDHAKKSDNASLSDVEQQFSHWGLNSVGSGNSNRRSRVISRTSVPSTVSETDEKYSMATPSANILLSVYDDDKSNQTLLPSDNGAQSQVISRSTSPIPSQNNPRYRSSSGSNGKQQQYGQFLNPNDRVEHENGYTSDHSDHSYRSATSKNTRRKSSGHHTNGHKQKEKKNSDVVDMQLLEDVPAWLRSLRLHKYNPIFEKMKWQDMLKLSDEELLAKGVAALGARRKLLKVFDQVKAHCEANNIKY